MIDPSTLAPEHRANLAQLDQSAREEYLRAVQDLMDEAQFIDNLNGRGPAPAESSDEAVRFLERLAHPRRAPQPSFTPEQIERASL